jgi:type IV pilus assembly protein PilY1
MAKTKLNLKHLLKLAIPASMLLASSAFGAPGTLPKAPLFLANSVEPNVFFTLDDSTSMTWELMYPEGLAGITYSAFGQVIINGRTVSYWNPEWHNNNSVVPPVSTDDKLWLFRNHNANALYYNPSITYRPWPGIDGSGNPMYSDADPTQTLRNPNSPNGSKTNLTTRKTWATTNDLYLPTYYTWTDSNNNGQIEATDTHTRVEIAAGTPEMQNFANWFQYYRSRAFAAKAAFGALVNESTASRMGVYLINGGHLLDPKSMTSDANRRALLSAYYNSSSSGFTPLRKALEAVGGKFSDLNSNFILPISEGGECQQNFNILMTDGYWNDEFGGTDFFGNPLPDAIASNDDGDNDTTFDGSPDQNDDGGNFADSYSSTLADFAMYFYENDLVPTYANKVPPSPVDSAEHQHLVNYTVSFGLQGTLDSQTVSPLDAGFAWPDPTPSSAFSEKIDDLWHAAYNSRGQYLNTQNPEQLQRSFSESVKNIAERTATAAAVAVNSARLTSESVVYLAQFNSNGWQGDLLAYPIIDLDQGDLAANPRWSAGDVLDARNLITDPRRIITYDGSNGVPFRWDITKLSSAMLGDLRTNASGNTDSDTIAEARLDYLRGDQTHEGSGYQFRPRLSLLGDIVNSGPVFVGGATLSWPDTAPFPTGEGNRYSDFKAGIADTRTKVVYVGANDGMLHAFDDETGRELLAYVPNLSASTGTAEGLHYLTQNNYLHNWYVDLTPTLSDVYMTTNSGSGWRTILIGGLRGGGRGLYALDVTNPANFSEANADAISMWEFSNANDADLGYTYSRPVIAMGNDGRWYAYVGNGYNDSGTGEAQLFIIDIEAGINNAWGNTNYKKISTKVGTTADRNGLASPALADLDGNGTVDRIYAGDLKGNMWVFDLSNSNPSRWDSAYKQGANPKPLFTTENNRPITAKPVLAKHPTIPFQSSPSNAPNLMVFFGTGQFLVDADKTNTDSQSFYGVWDQGDAELTTANLVAQTYVEGTTNRVLTNNFVDYSTYYGWKISLPDSGERAVTSPIARGNEVFFNTFVPVVDPCTVGGYGFRFAVDMASGGAPREPVVDYNRDGTIDTLDNENGTAIITAIRQEGYLPEPVFIEDLVFTGSIAKKIKELPNVPSGRFSWQELTK